MLKAWCCWGTDYCKCGCLGLTRNQNVKVTYIMIIVLSYIISYVINMIVDPHYPQQKYILDEFNCSQIYPLDYHLNCYQGQIIFRVSLVLSIMHLILFFLMLLRNQISKISNEGAWFIKFIYILVASLVMIKIFPNFLIHSIHSVSQYLIIIWYLIQNLIIIDFIYNLDSSLNSLAEQHQKIHIIKAIISFMFIGVAIFLNVSSYLAIEENSSQFAPIINSIILLIGFIVVFLRVFKGNTLLVFGLIAIYLNFQVYAIKKHPSSLRQGNLIGYIQTFITFICLFLILSPGSNKVRTKKSAINDILALNTSRQQQDIRYVSSNKWIIFHYIFFVICLILSTVVTSNFGIVGSNEQNYQKKVEMFELFDYISWIIAILIYGWTLISARLYPQQDFSQLQNYFKEYELN